MAGFTPGPWRAERNDGCKQIKAYTGRRAADHKRQWHEVACTPGLADDEVDLANASLIAAAPELYEALDQVDDWLRSGDGDGQALMLKTGNALAKARGE